jgi:hypothetical protein
MNFCGQTTEGEKQWGESQRNGESSSGDFSLSSSAPIGWPVSKFWRSIPNVVWKLLVKPIVDALKSINERVMGKTVGRAPGWFFDDSEDYLDLHVVQIVTGEEPWTELTLYGRLEQRKK